MTISDEGWRASARPLLEQDRKTVSSILLTLNKGMEEAIAALQEQGWDIGSPAAERDGAVPEEEVRTFDLFAPLVAAQHELEALAKVLRLDYAMGAPVMALARAQVEALGRAWYLLKPDERSVHDRASILQIKELSYVPKAARLLQGQTGQSITAGARIRELRAERGGLALEAPGYRELFMDVANAAGLENAKDVYSLLSGGAHGEIFAAASMQVAGDDADVRFTRIGIPLWTAHHAIRAVVLSTVHVVDSLATDYGRQAVMEVWEQRRRMVVTQLEGILRPPHPEVWTIVDAEGERR